MEKNFLGKGSIQKIVSAIAIIVLVVAILFLAAFLIRTAVHNEAQKAKTELIEKAKKVENFNDSAAAKNIAKTIHKFKTFKNKVKNELKTLDSTDDSK
jgi:uncharacterized membrane protein